MSYQVIARKYRPQSFLELIGQEHVATSLLNSLRNKRMPQALLFTGTRGVGKTSSARIFAKSIRCPNSKDFVPCNECSECKTITEGSNVDVLEIDGASNNGVDAIRELRDSVSYMPASGPYKVYIIDEVHMLSNSAFNALLKTLEEPPSHVIFIFATTEPQKIPLTILSRCQRYDFRKVSTLEITELLKQITKKEEISHQGESLWLIAKNANGSVRDALSALDLCISFCGKELNEKTISEILGITDRNLRANVLKALAERDSSFLLNTIEHIAQSSVDPKVFLQNLLEDLRNLLVIKINTKQKEGLVDISESEKKDFSEIAEQLSEEEIHLLFDMALKGASDLQKAFEPKIVLEMIFLRMVSAPKIHFFYADPDLSQKTVEKKSPKIEKVAKKEATPSPKPAPIASEKKENPVSKKLSQPVVKKESSELKKDWSQWIEKLEEKNPLLANKLKHAAVETIEENSIQLSLNKEQEFLLSDLNEKENIKQITNFFIAEGFPKDLKLQFFLNKEGAVKSPMQLEKDAKEKKELEIRKEIESSPLYQEAKKVFNIKNPQIKELL